MGDTEPELIKAIVHYQQCLEKYARRDDESKMLYCIGKLHKLPIAIEHLEQTGVGRTVNSLRRLNGNVGEAAKELVNKWKEMVVGKDSPAENSSKPESSRYYKEEKRRHRESSSSYKHKETKIKLEEEKRSDNEEDISSRIEKVKDKYAEDIENNHSSRNSSHKLSRKKEDSENEERERYKLKLEHKSHKSEPKKRKYDSDSDSEDSEVEKSKYKSSKRKSVDEDDNHYKIKNKHKYKSSKKKSEETDEDNDSENNRQSDSEEEEKIVYKDKYKEKPHSSREKDKLSSKHKSNYSKPENGNHLTKEKEKSKKHDTKSSKHSNHSSNSQEKEKGKSKKSKHHSSKHKEKEKSKNSGGKSKTSSYENGIGSESGTSFAEALGMLLPPSSSKLKKKSTPLNSSIQERAVENDDSPRENSKPEVCDILSNKKTEPLKLEPLNINMANLLPEITPNYRPLGNVSLDGSHVKNKISSEEEALGAILNAKISRTKVYSGNKVAWGKVPTLFDLCTHVLQDNIDALEYTGGVPYLILKPVIERANPDQLFMLEHHNPYLIEETDELWQLHCQREFRTKKREEMETWRDMYMRCLDEREAKLKALTANIKQSQDKSLPVRQTKLAYVDGHSIVKPPRNVARQQAKHGTGSDKKPLVTPSSRLSALATAGEAGKISVPNPGAKAASSSGGHGSSAAAAKPKKAPLMQKTLALMKNRMFRR